MNIALNEWGDRVLMRVAEGLLGKLSPDSTAWQQRKGGKSVLLPGVRAKMRKSGRVRYYAYKMDDGKYVSLGGHATESEAFEAVRRSADPNFPKIGR